MISLPPRNSPVFVGSTASGIQGFIEAEPQRAKPPSYVLFTDGPPSSVTESLNNPFLFGSKGARIFYDKDLRRLVLSLPANPHEVAERHLTRTIDRVTISLHLEANTFEDKINDDVHIDLESSSMTAFGQLLITDWIHQSRDSVRTDWRAFTPLEFVEFFSKINDTRRQRPMTSCSIEGDAVQTSRV
jgi:hypothetical protein